MDDIAYFSLTISQVRRRQIVVRLPMPSNAVVWDRELTQGLQADGEATKWSEDWSVLKVEALNRQGQVLSKGERQEEDEQ